MQLELTTVLQFDLDEFALEPVNLLIGRKGVSVEIDRNVSGDTGEVGTQRGLSFNPTFHVRMKNPRISWGFA